MGTFEFMDKIPKYHTILMSPLKKYSGCRTNNVFNVFYNFFSLIWLSIWSRGVKWLQATKTVEFDTFVKHRKFKGHSKKAFIKSHHFAPLTLTFRCSHRRSKGD